MSTGAGSDTALFVQRLAYMLRSGVPLREALGAATTDAADDAVRGAGESLLTAVTNGRSLAEAMTACGGVFDRTVVLMVQSAERGKPENVSQALVRYAELCRALPPAPPGGGEGESAEELAELFGRMAALLQSGVTLVNALLAAGADTRGGSTKRVGDRIVEALNEGHTVLEGMGMFPGLFDNTVQAMMRSGEKNGALDRIAADIAGYYRQR